jgi:hypothetical protein
MEIVDDCKIFCDAHERNKRGKYISVLLSGILKTLWSIY